MAKRRTYIIVGLGSAAVFLLAGVAFTSDLPVDVRSGLISCTPPDPNVIELFDQRSACVKAVLTSGADRYGVAEVNRLLGAAIVEHPEILPVCHEAAHAVGRRAHLRGESLVETILQAPEEGCSTGLLHGMLDAWAADEPTREELQTLVTACSDTTSPGHDAMSAGRCAEGVGHAIWTAFGGAELCLQFPTLNTRSNCGSGIVMASYWPVGAIRPLEGRTQEDVIRLCATWPAGLDIDGCWTGAAYAFQYELSSAAGRVPNRKAPTSSMADQIHAAAEHQASQCRRVTGEGHLCEEGLLFFLPSRLQEWPDVAARVCATFRTPEKEKCLSITSTRANQSQPAPPGG